MSNQNIITFNQFLQKNFLHYQIVPENEEVIEKLGLWATRDPAFEDPKLGMYLDKGLFLTGKVGSGKTELMKNLNYYLGTLGSPYKYEMKTVWKFAASFKDEGFSCFRKEISGNRFYDELALTDAMGEPTREQVNHFGNKITIGEELIRMRYEAFKSNGYITCFTTNESAKKMATIYGERADDRLAEMCNFFVLNTKVSWRRIIKPVPATDVNQNAIPNRALRNDDLDTKIRLNEQYKQYCQGAVLDELATFDYLHLTLLGQEPVPESELLQIMDKIYKVRKEYVANNKSTDPAVAKRNKELIHQYENGNPDKEEQGIVFREARVQAINIFYAKMKAAGKDKIFEDV